jgi:hypothetical protein
VRIVLFLLAILPGLVHAQVPVPAHTGRPAFATRGAATMPMMYVDEASLPLERFEMFPLPLQYWREMLACAKTQGYDVSRAGLPPMVLVIPAVRTIRVHDMAFDSLLYANDSTFMGEHWAAPTVGYALTRLGVILTTEAYKHNKYTLRHEALHFILIRGNQSWGHPNKAYVPCDKLYE